MRVGTRHVGALVASVALLSACGSSSSSSDTAAAGAGSASSSQAPASLKIMVGGLNKQIYLPNMLAQQLGYFKEQNLDVTLIDEASGQSSEEQVLTGNVDAGSGSYNHTLELQVAGKSMETVVQLQVAPGEAEMVSTQAAGSVKSAGDLNGKNLGVTERGSGTETLTTALLGRQGIKTDQVHFIPVGAGTTFIAAMQQGKIDAGMTTEPTISLVISKGLGKVLVDLRTPESTRAALGGDYPFISVFMATDYVNSHKDVVQRLVNAYVKTMKYIASHTAAEITDKMPPDYYAASKADYIAALNNQLKTFTADGRMPASGPQTVSDIETKYVPSMIGKTVDLSKTFTNEFTDKANA